MCMRTIDIIVNGNYIYNNIKIHGGEQVHPRFLILYMTIMQFAEKNR